MLVHAIPTDATYEFAAEVRDGLTRPGQKELPSKYFYDDVGSALFEVISRLPEYGLTRADERLLRRHSDEIVDRLPRPVAVAELGSGSGKKTRWLLQALARRQRTFYYPVEISRSALAMCERELSDIDSISILGFEREYLDGLLEVAAYRKRGQHLCVLFLGSTIGNFDRLAGVEFLAEIRRILEPGDSLLLGTDLEKPSPQLLRAYDDELGVTAAFNLNLLARINRELDANFDLGQFAHLPKINHEARSVEMHLRSKRKQAVSIPAALAGVEFLAEIRRILEPGDSLLLGTDLEKPSPQLLRAYDDELGVTAAFNLNLLARINRELDANFELGQFAHLPKINHEARSVEMHLRSKRRQAVSIPAAELEVEFLEDETIWTESSHKYLAEEISGMALDAGFRCDAQWIDQQWPFAENLLIAE